MGEDLVNYTGGESQVVGETLIEEIGLIASSVSSQMRNDAVHCSLTLSISAILKELGKVRGTCIGISLVHVQGKGIQ